MLLLCAVVAGVLGFILVKFLRVLHQIEVKRWGAQYAGPGGNPNLLEKLLFRSKKKVTEVHYDK